MGNRAKSAIIFLFPRPSWYFREFSRKNEERTRVQVSIVPELFDGIFVGNQSRPVDY